MASLDCWLTRRKTTRKKQKSSRYIKINSSWCCAGITGLLGLPGLIEQVSPTRKALQAIPTVDPTIRLLQAAQKTGFMTGRPGYLLPEQQQIMGAVEQIPGAEAVTQYERLKPRLVNMQKQ